MVRTFVLASTLVALGWLYVATPASAQFRGYADDGYNDPGFGGTSAYEPFYYPPSQRSPVRPPTYEQTYDYSGPRYPGVRSSEPPFAVPQYDHPVPDDRQYADPRYVEPYDGGRGQGAASDYDLGAAVTQRTVTEVRNPTDQPPGTIVIDTASRHLYYTQANGQALQYGIGVGRQGFAWKGTAKVERKAEWPSWTPPVEMVQRRPDLPARMDGGIDNPLGARALYLFQGKRDTLFRIHGTNEPETIGKAVSSGCIRMMNGDVIDLYKRVPVGTKVVVL